MQLSQSRIGRGCRILCALCMCIVWTGWINYPAMAANAADIAARRQEAIKRVNASFAALAAAEKKIARDTFSISDVAASIGNDPAAVAAWVRDQTTWVPYEGALRGPIGVLMDRRGNSVDRASLLAELLRVDGKTLRLAHATLPDATATKLAQALAAKPIHDQPIDTRTSDQVIADLTKTYGEPYGLDPADLTKVATDILTKGQHRVEDLVARTNEQSTTLGNLALGTSTPVAPISASDHWWVQWQDNGTWHDLDLEPIDGQLPAPADTLDWTSQDGKFPFTAQQCHEVELRVIVEKCDAGNLSEQTVFHQTLRPMELIGQNISIGCVPLQWPGDLDMTKEKDRAAKLNEVAMQQHEWMPLLRIGSNQFHQSSFMDDGSINEKPNLDALGKVGGSTVNAAKSALGAFDMGEPTAPTKSTGVLTAQWLEYEVRVPGQPKQIIRREIFDLLGPAARATKSASQFSLNDAGRLRRSISLLNETAILPLACQVSPAFVDELSAKNLLRLQKPLVTLVGLDDSDHAKINELAGTMGASPQMPAALYDVALARCQLNPKHASIYLDRPNILTSHQYLRDHGDGSYVFCLATDIVANDIAVRPGDAADAMRDKLMTGVLDTNAESIAQTNGTPLHNVSDVLSGAPDAAKWLVVKSVDDAAWKQLNVSADSRARVEAELKTGCVAVVPREIDAQSTQHGINWWRVDPRSGSCLGMGEQGWGPELAEYAYITIVVFTTCVSANIIKNGFDLPSGKTVGICAVLALGSALTLSGELTALMLGGYALLGTAGGLGI